MGSVTVEPGHFHALEQMRYRGATKKEVIEAIKTCSHKPAELGRFECRKEFPHNTQWRNHHYKTKQIRPVFVEEADKIVVVTVYVYFVK